MILGTTRELCRTSLARDYSFQSFYTILLSKLQNFAVILRVAKLSVEKLKMQMLVTKNVFHKCKSTCNQMTSKPLNSKIIKSQGQIRVLCDVD